MRCREVPLPGGGVAIVCEGAPRRRRCRCGAVATLACDWKTGEGGKTCSRAICQKCASRPAKGKHLCPIHTAAFEAWKAAREERERQGSLTFDPAAG